MHSVLRTSRPVGLAYAILRNFPILPFYLHALCCAFCCFGVHLTVFFSSSLFSPTDEETAEYIYDNLLAVDIPSSWLTQERGIVVATIQEELKALDNTGKTYEERVAAILAKLPSPTANFEDLPP